MYERVRRAWATLLDVDELRTRIVVRTESPFAPPGWVSLVRIDDAVTVTAPTAALAAVLQPMLDELSATEAVDLDVLRARLPVTESLGPSSLFYPSAPVRVPAVSIEVVDLDDVTTLLDGVPEDELDESGVQHVTDGLSVVRDRNGAPIAACGAMRWPADIAHLCVLTHPEHRGRGHARAVGAHAAVRAQADDRLPQWRARVEASKAVARSIGFVERGTQLRVLLS